eukprot:scaffold155977_cov54-Prasinocladus_malaysianus.AAC.1
MEEVREVLGGDVDAGEPLAAAGLDSLAAVELRNVLEEKLGMELPATLLYDYPTVEAVVEHLKFLMPNVLPGYAARKPDVADRPAVSAGELTEQVMEEVGDVLGEVVEDKTAMQTVVESAGARLPYDIPGEGVAKDMSRIVPFSRWDVDAQSFRSGITSTASRYGVWLEDVVAFDGAAFGMSDMECVLMDPQQRLLLESSWEAMQAGDQAQLAQEAESWGVFVGIWQADYHAVVRAVAKTSGSSYLAYHATGTNSSVASGRLSYVFGLKGPSMSLDTACSASL